MIVLGIHPGYHEASATLFDDYRVLGAIQLERLNRIKSSGVDRREWAWPCVDELLAMHGLTRADVDVVALTHAALPRLYYRRMQLPWRRLAAAIAPGTIAKRPYKSLDQVMRDYRARDPLAVFDIARLLADSGFRADVRVHWCNHHLGHALPALFFTDWPEALLYTADGIGDNISYSARSFRNGATTELFGGESSLLGPSEDGSLAFAYGIVTKALGFRMFRHEGKITGLAAYGQPTLYDRLASHFTVTEEGRVRSSWNSFAAMDAGITALIDGVRREDAAASIQLLLETVIGEALTRILRRFPHRRLGVSGGLFANVRLNRVLAETLPIDEIFIVPPMGDEGLSLGAGLGFLLERDGWPAWLDRRHRLRDLYWGRDYGDQIDAALRHLPGVRCSESAPARDAASRLADQQIGAIYAGRMEFGPRALGARSILANPSRHETHDELNRRLSRTEFMPFAPVVTAGEAARLFRINAVNAYAARFMTINTEVDPRWRDAIAAVVHIDGSARPQIIERETNPLYYDILSAFAEQTGIPALVNTSFNVHEEPIVNRPAECVQALADGRVDFVVTGNAVYSLADDTGAAAGRAPS